MPRTKRARATDTALGQQAGFLNQLAALVAAGPASTPISRRAYVSLLEESVTRLPGAENHQARLALCHFRLTTMRPREAAKHARTLVTFPETMLAGSLLLARAYSYLQRKDKGLQVLSPVEARAGELQENDYFSLLQLLLQFGAVERAQILIDGADGRFKNTEWLRATQGQLHLEQGDCRAALDVLDTEFARSCRRPEIARNVWSVRGRALETLGRYMEAFESFEQMNVVARRSLSDPPQRDIVEAWRAINLRQLPHADAGESVPYVPVFLIGFPRSGTTLLETLLDTQQTVTVLSETDGIRAARQAFTDLGRTYPGDLAKVLPDELTKMRQAYFAYNSEWMRRSAAADIVVDKLPLNMVHIPFIRMLFPAARFILCLRHPLDVILSCFEQNFVLVEANWPFVDLQQSFRYYEQVMSLFEHDQTELELDMHTVRYEELVDDLESIMPPVFNFLGCHWNDHYLDFHRFNTKKVIITPSRTQVVKPIYDSSRFRWRNYARQLEPYYPIVKAIAEKFGYTAEYQ